MAFEVLGKIMGAIATGGASLVKDKAMEKAAQMGNSSNMNGKDLSALASTNTEQPDNPGKEINKTPSAGNGGFFSNLYNGMQGQNIVVHDKDGSVDWVNTGARALGKRFISGGPARQFAGSLLSDFNQPSKQQ